MKGAASIKLEFLEGRGALLILGRVVVVLSGAVPHCLVYGVLGGGRP